jgi:hypothetical protein
MMLLNAAVPARVHAQQGKTQQEHAMLVPLPANATALQYPSYYVIVLFAAVYPLGWTAALLECKREQIHLALF